MGDDCCINLKFMFSSDDIPHHISLHSGVMLRLVFVQTCHGMCKYRPAVVINGVIRLDPQRGHLLLLCPSCYSLVLFPPVSLQKQHV